MRTKNIFSLKKLTCLFLIGTVGFTGCKKFLDVNQNPNNPDTATPSLLLPTVEASIGQVVGNAFQIPGNFYAQYWTQNPNASQYKSIEQYSLTNASWDRVWGTIYRNALENAQIIINDKTPGNQYIKGMAYVLKAYTFQLATDAFGDIPLSQSLQGNTYSSPKYESQQMVYDSIYNYIDKGIALLNTADATSPGLQDVLFQGDIDQWKAFANTLKLRAYLRIYYKDQAKAKAGIAALYAANAVFLTEDAAIQYSATGGNENPLYNEMLALGKTPNIVASSTAINAYYANKDPRLFKLYDPIPGHPADSITAIAQGSYQENINAKVSLPSALVAASPNNAASATVPVKLISASESYFLQAEAAAHGIGTGNVVNLFNSGVSASFVAVGLTPADATTYLGQAVDGNITGAATEEAKVKVIIYQKYYAMCGIQGFEAWTEQRRTGYPTFFVTSAATLLGPGLMPERFIYPSSEATTNLNYPGTVPLTTPVWWDAKP
ncbi:MAG TPA: SusD/RagB family nutrient-binding outer membrane lipoprotein [Mucilaginibacter sp.]|nr:SusD/RagB family nutrient-binding outer membrane lipoprotein [Mucilaginibacter sp.]